MNAFIRSDPVLYVVLKALDLYAQFFLVAEVQHILLRLPLMILEPCFVCFVSFCA